jgi:hypothetical protein
MFQIGDFFTFGLTLICRSPKLQSVSQALARKQNFKGPNTQMRKIMMILTLAISGLAVSATLTAGLPVPNCFPNCVLVR